jgi:uncharacterized protein YjbJ (UPF0337 family)
LRVVWTVAAGEARPGPADEAAADEAAAAAGKEVAVMSKRDKARNTAQAAKGKAKRAAGKAAGDPYAQAKGGAEKKKANLKQAGEKLKDTAKK